MQSGEQTSELRVDDPLQATAFENPLRARVLIACGAEERSLSDLRRLLGVPLPKLHYHVARLLDAKLLTVIRTQPRAGRPVRFYRAVAERFLVPQESLPALPSEAWLAELRRSLHDEIGRAGEVALLYGPGAAAGTFQVRLIRPEPVGLSRSIELWRILKLTPRQRTALAKELAEVLERHAKAKPESGAESFLAHAAFAPRRT
jgi:DNA-binding transcriptional ArsR family regulator